MKLLTSLCLALTMGAVAVPSYATSGHVKKPEIKKHIVIKLKKKIKEIKTVKSVPEIGTSGAGVALALLGGIAAVGTERRRKS